MRLSARLLSSGSLGSALFRLSGHPNRSIIPDFPISERLDGINENFRLRGLKKRVDVDLLRKDLAAYESVNSVHTESKNGDREPKELKELERLRDLEQRVLVPYLRWPNDLLRPCEESEVVYSNGNAAKLDFKPRSHLELSSVIASERGAGNLFYLGHHLAECELNLLDMCEVMLCEHSDLKCKLVSCPDVVRALVLEGCGHKVIDDDDHDSYDYRDNRPWLDMRSVQEFGRVQEGRSAHLVGGSSLPAMISFVSKTVLNNPDNVLPITFVSLGRNFQSVSEASKPSNLFNSNQTSAVSVLGLCSSMESLEALRDRLLNVLIAMYTHLDVHFCVERVSAPALCVSEMEAFSILMHSSFEERAIEVGRLSLYGPYLSQRLMIKCVDVNKDEEGDKDHKRLKDVFVLGGTVLRVNALLAAAIENTQTSNGSYTFHVEEYQTKVH